jgi:HPt (histidine-containing phosphotransfer) domain-containing protein
MSAASRLDASALAPIRALSAQTGKDLLGRVIDAFCESTPKLLADIESSLAAADLATLRRAAHTLKSGSATLGATQLSALASALESRARDGATDRLLALVAPLAAEASAVTAELHELRARSA